MLKDNITAAQTAMQKNNNISAGSSSPSKNDNISAANIAMRKNENNISERTEQKIQQAQGEQKEKKKFNFKKWLKGNSQQEYIENISFTVIIAAVVFLWFGMALGSFIKYTVLLAAFGCFLLLIGICIFIASQMIEKKE